MVAEDVDELEVGFVEPASFADAPEATVQLERAGAVPVGEKPARLGRWWGHLGLIVVGCRLRRLEWL